MIFGRVTEPPRLAVEALSYALRPRPRCSSFYSYSASVGGGREVGARDPRTGLLLRAHEACRCCSGSPGADAEAQGVEPVDDAVPSSQLDLHRAEIMRIRRVWSLSLYGIDTIPKPG